MFDYAHKNTDKILAATENEIRGIYIQALTETQEKLDDYLRRFAIKDAIKQEKLAKGEITRGEYDYWKYGQICMGKRWQAMVDTLAEDYTHADQLAASAINGHTPEIYALNHNFAAYEIEHETELNLSYTLYDSYTVEKLIRDKPDLLPASKVDIPKAMQWNKANIRNAVTQGVLQGESISNLSKRLLKVANMGNVAAVRNARTMTTCAENAGRLDSYKHAVDMGIEMQQQWLATLDSRTRYSHRQLDGEVIKVGDKWHHYKFSNGCRYPGDPQGPPFEVYNCRCTLVPVIAGIDQSKAPRNSKLGEMSYEEWKDANKPKERKKTAEPTPQKEEPKNKAIDAAITKLGNGVQPTPDEFIAAGREVSETMANDKTYKELADRMSKNKEIAAVKMEEYKKYRDEYSAYDTMLKKKYQTVSMRTPEENAEKDRLYNRYIHALNEYTTARDAGKAMEREYAEFRSVVIAKMRGETRGFPVGFSNDDIKAHFHGQTRNNKGRVAIEDAYGLYPTGWVQASLDYGRITTGTVDRGYCGWNGAEVMVSGWDDASKKQTAVHELGHRFESVFPQVLKAETDFYDQRTAGEKYESLRALTGVNYAPTEVTKKDHFVDPYMGKDYGGKAYEIMSMGAESAMLSAYNMESDPEYLDFITGLFVTIGRK